MANKPSILPKSWRLSRSIGRQDRRQYNGNEVMVAKVKGEFNWHSHPETDDFFLVLKGRLTIKLRDGDVVLGPGEMYIVPKGVEHCPSPMKKRTSC